jgi:hypothetical protein
MRRVAQLGRNRLDSKPTPRAFYLQQPRWRLTESHHACVWTQPFVSGLEPRDGAIEAVEMEK